MEISPAVGRSSPAIIRSRVVFPEPEEPSSTRNSPSRIERSTPSTACRSPNCFLKFRISMPATVGALAPRFPAVRGRVGRLGEVYRRGGDDTGRGLPGLGRAPPLRPRGRGGAPPAGCGAPRPRAAKKRGPPNGASMVPPSLPSGPIAGGVVRRRTTREPIAKIVGFPGQSPFLEDRQRHRTDPALAGTGGEALLLQPAFELVGLRVGRDGPL